MWEREEKKARDKNLITKQKYRNKTRQR
jgi:hypothetical protein